MTTDRVAERWFEGGGWVEEEEKKEISSWNICQACKARGLLIHNCTTHIPNYQHLDPEPYRKLSVLIRRALDDSGKSSEVVEIANQLSLGHINEATAIQHIAALVRMSG